MRAETPTKTISAVMGLAAFAIAMIAGWAALNPLDTILSRAIVAMVVCYAVGQVLGWAATKAASEHMTRYRADRPIPKAEAPKQRNPDDAQDPRTPREPDTPDAPAPEAEVSRAAA